MTAPSSYKVYKRGVKAPSYLPTYLHTRAGSMYPFVHPSFWMLSILEKFTGLKVFLTLWIIVQKYPRYIAQGKSQTAFSLLMCFKLIQTIYLQIFWCDLGWNPASTEIKGKTPLTWVGPGSDLQCLEAKMLSAWELGMDTATGEVLFSHWVLLFFTYGYKFDKKGLYWFLLFVLQGDHSQMPTLFWDTSLH